MGIVRLLRVEEVAGDALIELLLAGLELVRREVLVSVVHRLELAAVDRHQRLLEQPDLPAQLHELAAGLADAGAVVATEVGDRLEVRGEPPREPDQLEVALRLALKASARGQAVEVAVNVDPEQRAGVVRWSPGRGRLCTFEPELCEVEFVDQRINRPYRVVLGDPVVQTLREQRGLRSALTFDEPLHRAPLRVAR
jgi:hypothetical protein